MKATAKTFRRCTRSSDGPGDQKHIHVQSILERHNKVHFWYDEDAQKETVNEIDDYLYDDLKTKKGIELSLDNMDEIIEKVLQVAKHRTFK